MATIIIEEQIEEIAGIFGQFAGNDTHKNVMEGCAKYAASNMRVGNLSRPN